MVIGSRVVASNTFSHGTPAAGTGVSQVVDAFEQSLHRVTADLAAWTLIEGDRHAGTTRTTP